METRKIDRLFRKKLVSHTSQPDPQAWSDLEKMIERKNKKAVIWYYKVAASVVLVLLSGVFAYRYFDQNETPEIAEVQIETQKNVVAKQESEDSGGANAGEVIAAIEIEPQLTVSAEPKEIDKTEITIEQHRNDNPEPKEEKYLVIIEEENDGKITVDSVVVDLDNMQLASNDENSTPESTFGNEEQPISTQKKKKTAVRITYKTAPKKVAHRRVMIVAKLDTMKRWRPDFRNILKLPGSLLADVRDAKNNLFNQESGLDRSEIRNTK